MESWDSTTREASSTTTAHRITGLTNGTTYTVRVAAVNAQGTGAWSAEATGIPVMGGAGQVPGAPTGLTLTAGAGALTGNWTAPANAGGSVITSYRVQWKSGVESWDSTTREASSTTTAHRITGLTNGTTYTVRVAAVNAQGTGAWSAEATGIPVTLRGDDRVALVALYNATAGPSWTDNSNWLTGEPIIDVVRGVDGWRGPRNRLEASVQRADRADAAGAGVAGVCDPSMAK